MAEHLHQLIKPRRAPWGASGYTLVEVVVAMLLTSLMVTAVMSVAITTRGSGKKNVNKLTAEAGDRRLADELKNYVTGDTNPLTSDIPGPGPGTINKWSITGPNPLLDVQDSMSCAPPPCYALANGTHDLINFFPATFEAPPFNARISYVVTQMGTLGGRPVPQVVITASWTQP